MAYINLRRLTVTSLVLFSLIVVSCSSKDSSHSVIHGVIDSSGIDLGRETIALDGDWEFYWNRLYSPADFKKSAPEKTGYIRVPGVWNGYRAGTSVLNGDGYATYRIIITGAPAGHFGFKIPTMATAYRMWVNGIEVSSNGTISTDNSMIPMQKPRVALFDSTGRDIEVVVQVSNFMSDKGGIWSTIYFGKRDLIITKRDFSISREMLLLGAFFIVALYHFGLFYFRRKNSFSLYFGLVCLVFTIRILLTGEFLLVNFFPAINWHAQIKTEFITVYAGFTFFVIFIRELYSKEFSMSILRFNIIAGIFFTAATIILPVKLSARFLPLYHVILLSGFLYIIYALFIAAKKGRDGAMLIFFGCIVFAFAITNDILDSNEIINSLYLYPFGLFIFLLSHTIILAKLIADSFNSVENLSEKLGESVRQIDEYSKTLEIKVFERTSELDEANRKLLELDRAKTDFFANISHELRTPLTLILAPVEEAISGRALDGDTLEMIRRNGRNLLSLINDLLDIARITAGGVSITVSMRDISADIREFCGMIEPAAELKGINLECVTPGYPVNAYIDTGLCARIMSNLFSNSFRFTESGGEIRVSLEVEDNCAVIRFSDTGHGIPSNMIEKVFDRFVQAGPAPSGRHQGTGIGLSIVKDILNLHSGEITVESRYIDDSPSDHGTTFTIRLQLGKKHLEGRKDVIFDEMKSIPVVELPCTIEPDNTGDQKVPDSGHLHDERLSVLIVEDNRDMRNMLTGILRGKYNIFQASNGFEALSILDTAEQIDLVLSDIMMPEIDGHELLRRIRGDEKFEGLPVIFLTARADGFMKIEGLELGAVDYITKPFNPDELTLRIKNQLEMKSLRNSISRNFNSLLQKLKDAASRPVNSGSAEKIEAICAFIRDNFTQELERSELAKAAGLNPDTLSRLFNAHTGVSLSDYICSVRIDEAKRRLIATDETVTRICIDTGFDSIRTFNRVFKKDAGMSPVEFRERFKLSALKN